MPGQTVKLLKVFIASPGDVMLEREKARDEILSLRALAHKHGFDLEATGWETHAAPGMGRSQARINQLVIECDLLVGILWRRFGLPTGEAESGTLEEFNLARERYAKESAPEIMLYFREVHPDFLADPGPQLHKVLEFKQQVEDGRLALYANYRDPEHFASLLRQHITDWLLKLVPDNRPGAPSARAVEEIPPLSAFTEHLEFCRTELQKTARPLRLRTLALPPLFLEEVEAERPRNMKVSIAVKTFPRLLILGEPGAGKTTSLKKLASEYAVWRGEGKEPGLNEPEDFNLPIFVDLSAYPTVAASDTKHGLWRLITASVRGVHDVDVHKRLAAGGCLLLFDGLNEVGEAYDEVVHHLRHLVHEIPHNRFVVACRPGIYREELRREFTAFQLERLSSFNASKVLEIEIGAEKAQPAWKGLDEYTRDLCRNPLMLTLLADELRASDNPPQNRAELFDRFIDRYLSEWARVKGAGSVRVEKEILSALAWRLGTSRTLLSADEAAAVMSIRLAELQSKNEAQQHLNVADLNREFLHHGLLRESAGQTGFFHQAVQEYFFAREVALHQSIEYVLKHVSDPEWAEVLVFVCGLVEDATEVVREVMKGDLYLAARCVSYSRRVEEKSVEDLATRLIQNLKTGLDISQGAWLGKFYSETTAILSIEGRIQAKLSKLFCLVHNESSRALERFAIMLLWLDYSGRAQAFVKPLVDEQSHNARLRCLLAITYEMCGDIDNSIAHFNECLRIAPEDAWILASAGKAYRTMNNLKESEELLRKALSLGKGTAWRHYQLGRTFLEKKDYENALNQFQLAINIQSDYGPLHIGLGDIYSEYLNQPEIAISEYEVAIKLDERPSRMSGAILKLARILERTGRIAEARQRYQEYLDRFPWGEHAQEALAALERLT
ncbi:NACHT domain-containing protein [candidate division KSB1 bacterium]|nr:MAG: NACHT domain-containing protein [candidate division KSB1 bacterium]MBC6949945.1 NACHT domain-containing protein [candidate division KSB1 bacterium]MCE7942676.1 NACHT domain-containing protein [Chlorobi bacterium CHB1]MDL1874816.1 NACHT domain-containing protein [Cytophagia bacterium CHB2]